MAGYLKCITYNTKNALIGLTKVDDANDGTFSVSQRLHLTEMFPNRMEGEFNLVQNTFQPEMTVIVGSVC